LGGAALQCCDSSLSIFDFSRRGEVEASYQGMSSDMPTLAREIAPSGAAARVGRTLLSAALAQEFRGDGRPLPFPWPLGLQSFPL